MRSRPDYYKNFIVVHPGGGTRRNPKRKNAGALSAVDTAGPSAADIEASFQRYLNTMAQRGTYGDNMEIGAFASRFLVHVIIYEEEYRQEQHHLPAKGVGKATRKAYIVRHVSTAVLGESDIANRVNSRTSITPLSETLQVLTQAYPTST